MRIGDDKSAVALAPLPPPPVKITDGGDEYPLPTDSNVKDTTEPPDTAADAVAPEPPPPVMLTAGAVAYKVPPDVNVKPITCKLVARKLL
jgi:hypothetical protein